MGKQALTCPSCHRACHQPHCKTKSCPYHRTIERIIGRDLCPACGGLGWFRDEQGVTNCSCGAKT